VSNRNEYHASPRCAALIGTLGGCLGLVAMVVLAQLNKSVRPRVEFNKELGRVDVSSNGNYGTLIRAGLTAP
jgi:hypothetical protein